MTEDTLTAWRCKCDDSASVHGRFYCGRCDSEAEPETFVPVFRLEQTERERGDLRDHYGQDGWDRAFIEGLRSQAREAGRLRAALERLVDAATEVLPVVRRGTRSTKLASEVERSRAVLDPGERGDG